MISAVRGAILNPRRDGTVELLSDGVLRADARGVLRFVGPADHPDAIPTGTVVESIAGTILPPFLDAHIHIPQHPIRGRFMEGVRHDPPEGRLLAGLNQNVFPAEARCSDDGYTRRIVLAFLEDTLAQGVVGGSSYMTVHPTAAEMALEMLPPLWSVGMVLMNQNCPDYLRVNESTAEADLMKLAGRFGKRAIITDRFAVAVSGELRRLAARVARACGLATQTHLNEQLSEKRFVEERLYPRAGSYTRVYADDGLLDQPAILAHCVHMQKDELKVLADHDAFAAHCPTSNTLLGSGIMPLDAITSAGIGYAICTDVGASPTTSMLCEMLQFLVVHRGRSTHATPREAVYRSTLAPAKRLGLDRQLGTFEPGMPLSFIEVSSDFEVSGDDQAVASSSNLDELILGSLLGASWAEIDAFAAEPVVCRALDQLQRGALDSGPELERLTEEVYRQQRRLEGRVRQIVLQGARVWQRK